MLEGARRDIEFSRPRLLLIGRRSIGDAVVSLPALAALKRHFGPQAQFSVLARGEFPEWSSAIDLFHAATSACDGVAWRDGSLGALAQLWVRLRQRRFDAAVFLEAYRLAPRMRWMYRALLHGAGIGRIIGLAPRTPVGADAAGRYPHIARIRLEQLAASGIDVATELSFPSRLLDPPAAARATVRAWLEARRRLPPLPLVAVCPGARSAANRWGHDRFVELGRRLAAHGGYELVVCGGSAEAAQGGALVAAWGQGINAAGAMTVLETAALFEQCAFMVGLDTGTTHLAAAVGTKCVTLQGGRTFPGNWDPLGEGHVVVRHPIECAGCGLTQCPLSRHPCMRAISVDDAMQAIAQIS